MVRFVNHINDFFLKNCATSHFLNFSINDAKLKKKRYNLQRLSKTDQTTENAILGCGVTWSSRLVDWPMRESITPV